MDTLEKALDSVIKKFDEKYLMDGESKTAAKERLINTLAHDILFFDDWYFTVGTDDVDERVERIKGSSSNGKISFAIRKAVEDIADELDELDLPKFHVDEVVGKLTWYVEHWEDWYYDLKVAEDQGSFFQDRNDHSSIYLETNYGYLETSQGVSNMYGDEMLPHSDGDVEVETVAP